MKSPQDMKIIDLETTNGCLRTCSNCTRFCGHHKRPFFMDYETFTKAVDSMKGFKGIVNLMGGEPTIHPHFEQFVNYFRSHFGTDDASKSLRQPTKDFSGYIVKNAMDIDHHNQRGLLSSLGAEYAEHFELIQDTFGFQALNDHTNPSMHEALLVTRKELGVPDEEWVKLRDACWIQNIWSASITPKGAFFCEIAASMDMLLDGPGGWPIEPGWWKRKPEEFGSQLQWCELCSAPLAMPKRNAREGVDDVSPLWYEKLQAIGSPKLKKGLVKKFDVAHYNAADYRVINESIPYLHDHALRIGRSNRAIYPQNIAVVLRLPNGLDRDAVVQVVEDCRRNVELALIVSEDPAHEEIAQRAGVALLNLSGKSGRVLFEELKRRLASHDWVLMLDNAVASRTLTKCIGSLVFNPGCLYLGRDCGSSETARRSGFMLFNFRAIALRDGADLADLQASYPCDKVVPLDVNLNRNVKIYLSYHDDAARIQNDILTPIHVGKALSGADLGMIGDDTGENISDKNPMYAELTAQYWAWKNDRQSEYVGFMHYRRALIFSPGHEAEVTCEKDRVVVPQVSESSYATYGWREADIVEALEGCDILLPLPYDVTSGPSRNCRQQCVDGHGSDSFLVLLELLAKHYPDYRRYAEEFFAQERMYLCNMFVMRRDLFEAYSEWLFGLLDKFVQHKNTDNYDAYQVRMPAFMAERLLNIYVRKLVCENPGLRVKEVPYVLIENTSAAPKPIAPIKAAKPVVHVVTAFDALYAPYFGAFLASMLDHASEARHYDVVVLEDGVPDAYKVLFDTMLKGRTNVGIRYVNMAGVYNDKDAICAYFTKSTLNRLRLPDLLPEHAKVVYIDPDTIVLRDLAELFDCDISGYYAGAALDYTFKFMTNSADSRVWPQFGGTTVKEYLVEYLQLGDDAIAKYFNAGVMTFNLDKIRNDGIPEVFDRLYRAKSYYCPDQDIMNKAFDGKIFHVDPRWNVLLQPLSDMKKAPYRFYKEYEATRKNPFILHYAGVQKPWNSPNVDFAEFFWQYCRQTPFYEKILFQALAANRRASGNGEMALAAWGPSNRAVLARCATALKTTIGVTLHRVSPSLHAYSRRFYHRIRNGS